MNERVVRRIGFVADGGDAGGARTHILALLSRLADQGIACYFFSLGEGALSHSVEKLEGVHFTAYPLRSKADPRIFKAIHAWAGEHRLDIIHTHGLKANMYGRLAFYRSSLPLITTYHSHPFYDYQNILVGLLFTLIDQLSLHRSNHFIAVSYEIATQLERRGIDRDKITIIKNGVDFLAPDEAYEKASRETIRKEWKLPQDAFVLGSLGRLVKVKGYDEMLRIFSACLKQSKQALYLLIIGGGQEETSLKKLAQDLGIADHLRWVGFQKNPRPYIFACDLMLFSPKSEALGIALLECMNAKRVVVSKKVGGIQELLLDRYNGRILSQQEELVKAIIALSQNPDQRKALAENGAQMVRRFFTQDRMVEKTALLYRKLKKDRIFMKGLPVDNLSMKDLLPRIDQWIQGQSCHQIITINLEMISRAQKEASFRQSIEEADLVVPDGISILKLARWMGEYISEKVAGVELGEELLKRAEIQQWKIFFLGTSEASLDLLRKNLLERFPRLLIAGTHHGFFAEAEESGIIQSINASKADLLLVGMGAGKQDCLIHRHKQSLKVKVAMGVGGSLDLWAGQMKRAPGWALKLNLEWLYRILSQPRLRLRRFLKTVPDLLRMKKALRSPLRRILISGYYGYGNIGDETILQTLIKDLHSLSHAETFQISVLSINPHMTTTLAEVYSSQRFALGSLWKELSRADGIISGGGGLIQDVTSLKSPWYYLGIIALSRLMGKRVFVYANGIGPLHSPLNRGLSKLILARASKISVRDQHSQDLLHSWGIRKSQLTVDPIFSYQAQKVQDPYPAYQDFIAVSLGPSRETSSKIETFARCLDELSQLSGKPCVFTPFYGTYDSRFSRKVMELMKQPAYLVDTFLLPEEMFSLLSRASFGVGMRLHFLVFLSRLSKPILPIIYDPKVAALCEQLSLSHAWRKGATEDEMNTQLQAFLTYAQSPVSYQSALKELEERNSLNQKDLEDFVCSLK